LDEFMADAAGSTQLPFEGQVDATGGGVIKGWAWFPSAPGLAAQVQVFVGGVLRETVTADQFRDDLSWAHKREGNCAFEWRTDEDNLVVAFRLPDGRELAGSPVTVRQGGATFPCDLVGEIKGYMERFGDDIRGWALPDANRKHRVISVMEGDVEHFKITADGWRTDLEDANQGDGRGGFQLRTPNMLRDGKEHWLDLVVDGRSIIGKPFRLWLPASRRPQIDVKAEAVRFGQGAVRSMLPVHFSFVVVFYNMKREAERTLTSLTRAYQRDSGLINYEVICVDNGSNPPLDENWIKSFGPEFRLVRPSKILPSPCFAINEAAQQARGQHVVVVVDGAHVLSPGVLYEAKQAIEQHPDTVVAVRHWFVGGDQRWLSAVGYTREMEDALFSRARWPSDGYKLFEISATMHENPNHWFDPIAESNCLFVPAELWRRMGGMDENFNEPGGGFCNLDLLVRAGKMAKDGVTALLGEATFHQFHEGTTTNVTDQEKDSRVRTYASKYRHMRGEDFANIDTPKLRLRGRMQTYRCYATRQRPLYQAPLGVTDRVRPGTMDRWLDLGAIEYLNGAYAESGLHTKARWRGQQLNLAPSDLTNLQEILYDIRPERIVLTKNEPELIRFLDDIATLEGLDETRIICVVDAAPEQPHPRVDYVIGAPYAAETLTKVEAAVGAVESSLVLFSPRADDFFPLEALRAYGHFVSLRSYLVVLRTVLGQPWLGYSKYWMKRVIFLFLRNSDFAHDETRDQHLITMCSGGYLLRTKSPTSDADNALEDIRA
jgi:cephalosporin hydroxylase